MIVIWPGPLAVVCCLALVCCARPAPQVTAAPPPVLVAKPKPKPVRLNGRGKVSSISITQFFPLHAGGEVLLFDARPGFFYGLGHIPGAIHLPKTGCDAQIIQREAEIKAALAAKKTLVVYCTNLLCPDARAVASHLASFGHSSSVLVGGWEAWKETGMPTE